MCCERKKKVGWWCFSERSSIRDTKVSKDNTKTSGDIYSKFCFFLRINLLLLNHQYIAFVLLLLFFKLPLFLFELYSTFRVKYSFISNKLLVLISKISIFRLLIRLILIFVFNLNSYFVKRFNVTSYVKFILTKFKSITSKYRSFTCQNMGYLQSKII